MFIPLSVHLKNTEIAARIFCFEHFIQKDLQFKCEFLSLPQF